MAKAAPKLRWRRDQDAAPAAVYVADEGFEILWDPAGPTEDERGGWYVSRGAEHLGIARTLSEAKDLAELSREET